MHNHGYVSRAKIVDPQGRLSTANGSILKKHYAMHARNNRKSASDITAKQRWCPARRPDATLIRRRESSLRCSMEGPGKKKLRTRTLADQRHADHRDTQGLYRANRRLTLALHAGGQLTFPPSPPSSEMSRCLNHGMVDASEPPASVPRSMAELGAARPASSAHQHHIATRDLDVREILPPPDPQEICVPGSGSRGSVGR